ncbi:hypothetical protein [Mycobacteroides abscessus]|uniref:hypothetical protein n=1 Tax=Mycobacteroides abscessus TaxID=36809 RepID=UPI000C257F3A|nr:hypothetical protein [Mycobacteroides abscessus]
MTDATDLSSVSSDLLLKFDPLTIEHLGSNMYSRLPNAVAELVANAYDADATEQLSIPVDRGVSGDLRFGVLIAV